jgi:hypothetical protein
MNAKLNIAIVPVSITPTKPLLPSHFKSFIWLDILYKCLSHIHRVSVHNNQVLSYMNWQTLRFWNYLDEQFPREDYSNRPEIWIGSNYVRCHQLATAPIKAGVLYQAYKHQIEKEAYVHPSAIRLMEIWHGYLAMMRIDPILMGQNIPLPATSDEALSFLHQNNCLTSLESLGGETFMDFTEDGLPLRKLIDADGMENYLLGLIRSLMGISTTLNYVYLLCDDQLIPDFLLLEKLMNRCGVPATKISLGRVPLNGLVSSAKQGGWEQYLFEPFTEKYINRYANRVFALGMRLYFVCTLGKTAGRSFSFKELEDALNKAEQLYANMPEPVDNEVLEAFLLQATNKNGILNPYNVVKEILKGTSSRYTGSLINLLIGA